MIVGGNKEVAGITKLETNIAKVEVRNNIHNIGII
jgi:hypothetical protein